MCHTIEEFDKSLDKIKFSRVGGTYDMDKEQQEMQKEQQARLPRKYRVLRIVKL